MHLMQGTHSSFNIEDRAFCHNFYFVFWNSNNVFQNQFAVLKRVWNSKATARPSQTQSEKKFFS